MTRAVIKQCRIQGKKVEIDSTVGVDHGIDGNKANRTVRMIANGGDAVVRVA